MTPSWEVPPGEFSLLQLHHNHSASMPFKAARLVVREKTIFHGTADGK